MSDDVVTLEQAHDTGLFGSKAVGLGDALRAGLPVPPGVALSGDVVEAVAAEDEDAIARVCAAVSALPGPLAVRSSAVDEDGADASFAGQHLTLLNVPSVDDVPAALREIWWSANSDSAITYRKRVGLFTRPSVGVVVQSLLDPDVAGVMFTRNPINGADECLVEATWGLGEAVVQGLVIPDNFRVGHSGEVLERTPGRKQVAIRRVEGGGTTEASVDAERVESLCLTDDELVQLGALGSLCEQIYGMGRDIEWAIADGTLYLLQCRAVTTGGASAGGGTKPAAQPVAPVESVEKVPLFAGLDRDEVEEIAHLFKERRFAQGETVVMEGASGAAFFMIDSGEATVTVHGKERTTLGPGDYFGEIALIDEGPRAATVTAKTDLVCHGLTFWEFRPLVEGNGKIGWKLLQSLAGMLRAAQQT
jgi:pyruvate,water dikinase